MDADPWLGANPFDPAFRSDPYPALRRLRETDPVNLMPVGVWRLTRYDDVVRLLTSMPTGIRRSDGLLPNWMTETPPKSFDLFMLQQDPPNHTRLRRLVSTAFSPKHVRAMRPHVESIVGGLLDRVAAAGKMDIIADLALPLPTQVICEMLGVPVADRTRFTTWTAAAIHLLPGQLTLPEVHQAALAAAQSLSDYFEELIADRSKHLGDDLLSGLIRAEVEGERLSHDEVISQGIGLLIAGFETTIGLIGNGTLALVRHPEQLEKFRSDPSLAPSVVDECMRFDGPVMITVRVLREDTEVGGKVIPADALVMAALNAANRDPAQFPDPDRFDITRDASKQIGFGGGVHFCLGAHLARMEAEVALSALIQRFHPIELVSETLVWSQSLFRVLERLPIRFPAQG